jgi:hypothetical protein
MRDDQKRALLADGGKDSSDTYRLKVANDCCDRLMQACSDAGCPDGVRMDDWIRENVRADGGKGEAVYQYKVRDLSGWHDCDAGAYERITTNMPEHVEARTLFTAPQAIGKGEAVQNVMNIPLDAAAAMADYTPQAECAPRAAQPVTEILSLLSKMHDECGTNAGQDALWDAHEAVKQLFAAPTPERAQDDESIIETPCHKDVGNHRIPKIKPRKINLDVDDYGPVERAQESAGVQDGIEDVAKYFEDCGDPYGAKMIRKYAFNKFAANKEPQP